MLSEIRNYLTLDVELPVFERLLLDLNSLIITKSDLSRGRSYVAQILFYSLLLYCWCR